MEDEELTVRYKYYPLADGLMLESYVGANKEVPVPKPRLVALMASSSSDELLQAEAQLWCHTFGYLKSTALQCAIKLGIPNAIDRCGGAASLSELHAALPVTASKRACLSRLMRFLAASGIFREEAADGKEAAGAGSGSCYSLTPVSRLLVIPDGGNDDDRNGHTCLSQLILFTNSPFHLKSSQCLAEWLQKEEEEDGAIKAETPLAMAQGGSLYSVAGTDVEYGRFINEAMASDSRFVAEIVVHECREVFTGVTSLMDVGGGDGTMAAAIAKAFPQIRCSVLELPHVVDAAPADCGVQFIAGDMMEFIPPADVLLLKWILHNWNDEDCVRILKRCKEVVSTREPKGKVVIIEVVVGSQSKQMLEAQFVSDLCMMLLTTGEERDRDKWQRIFQDAGFTQYKISPVLGFRSLIELYP